METDRLKYFCAIVDSGSMTKASAILGISHSGLSKAIGALQDEIGFKVFRPHGRGLELTDEGKELYRQSHELLRLVHQLGVKEAASPKSVRIGMPEVIALGIADQLVSEFETDLLIDELDSGETESRIIERKLDFGLTFMPFPHKDIEHLKIGKVPFASYARKGFFEKTPPERVPYVTPSHELKDNPLSIKIRDGWDGKYSRLTSHRANSFAIGLEMVRSGRCAMFAPVYLVETINRKSSPAMQMVEIAAGPRSTERTIFLAKRSAEDESVEMKKVAKVLRRYL